MRLGQVTLRNFRGFQNHTVNFKPFNLVVGKNNAGKSTLVEALRILSLVVNRFGNMAFKEPPGWTDLHRFKRGISPSLKDFDILEENLFYQYGDPPAVISAKFTTGFTIEIYLNSGYQVHAVLYDRFGQVITSKVAAAAAVKGEIEILPPLGPVLRKETILTEGYVRNLASSHLASSHFRNQLYYFKDSFNDFKRLATESWDRLRIEGIESGNGDHGAELSLLVKDHSFVAELAWMGHGLQVWLQTIWFICRTSHASVLIFDEPDVYLHADLQRKLAVLLKKLGKQIIIATHSIEFIAEVFPDQILIVDRNREKSEFATNLPSVQLVLNNIGSSSNIHLTRLWNSNRCVLVEGDDVGLLKAIQAGANIDSIEAIDRLPNFSIGGWNGWGQAVGSAMTLKNGVGETIKTYCIFDSDYRSSAQIKVRYEEAEKHGIELHVWKRKELENYLVHPVAISRLINRRVGANVSTEAEIVSMIESILEDLHDTTFDALSNEYMQLNREQGLKGGNTHAREILNTRWSTFEERIEVASGKAILKALSNACKKKFDVSFSPSSVARVMQPTEFDKELLGVLTAVLNGAKFETRS